MKKEKVERKWTRLINLFPTTDPIKVAVSTHWLLLTEAEYFMSCDFRFCHVNLKTGHCLHAVCRFLLWLSWDCSSSGQVSVATLLQSAADSKMAGRAVNRTSEWFSIAGRCIIPKSDGVREEEVACGVRGQLLGDSNERLIKEADAFSRWDLSSEGGWDLILTFSPPQFRFSLFFSVLWEKEDLREENKPELEQQEVSD